MNFISKVLTSPAFPVLMVMALHAFADDSAPCPAGKESACTMAQYQADIYNKGIIKREGKLGFDRAVAEGEVFAIRTALPFERKAFANEGTAGQTKMAARFSYATEALCGSEAYDLLVKAGGRYETQIFDKSETKWMTVPLDCEHPGQGAHQIN